MSKADTGQQMTSDETIQTLDAISSATKSDIKDQKASVDNNRIVRKILIDPGSIDKMKRLVSLYSDTIPVGAKEIDIISFFLDRAFMVFLKSGEIDLKIEEIKGGESL